MKNFISLSIIGYLFISCGGGGDDSAPENNTAPTIPSLVSPTDTKLCVENSVKFEWSRSTDPNGDPITYQIQVAKDNQFTQNVKTVEDVSAIQTIALDKNTAYYWRVKASDNKGLSSNYSITYKFYTAAETVINHLPFLPELPQPAINSMLNTSTATLNWNATDLDAADVLTYDVYFGTINPPTQKVGENLSVKTLAVALQPAKEYFWKVVVKDNKGEETVGQVWKFKTN